MYSEIPEETIKKHKLEDIICIDETSVNALMKRNHCYSEVGKRCVIKTTSQEVFKKYTAIFAINTNGVIGWELYEKGGIDSDRLSIFLDKFITKKYKNKLIILDNASSHRNEKIKELIKELYLDRSLIDNYQKDIVTDYISNIENNYRIDNKAWVSEMPNGETRVIYTRQNRNGAEEILNWHKLDETKKSNP